MKLFVVLSFATLGSFCSCAQLNNNYLPPVGAGQAGGGPGLKAPNAPGGGGGGGGGGAGARPGSFGGGGGGGNNALGGTGGRPVSFGGGGGGAPRAPAPPSGPAAPAGPIIEIISYESVNNGDGSYKFSYESANGIKAEETGDVKNKGSENAIQTVQGSYSYTSPEGQLIEITYVADENGFQAQGDSIPTPVPLPEEYLKALAEFEAAYATAVPDTAGAGGSGGGGVAGGSKTAGGNSGNSYPGGPSSQGYPGAPSGAAGARPQGPAASSRPQGNAPKPAGGQGGSFPGQPRPAGGSGSGNYNPQSGYSY